LFHRNGLGGNHVSADSSSKPLFRQAPLLQLFSERILLIASWRNIVVIRRTNEPESYIAAAKVRKRSP
jgi:hypothetical protein